MSTNRNRDDEYISVESSDDEIQSKGNKKVDKPRADSETETGDSSNEKANPGPSNRVREVKRSRKNSKAYLNKELKNIRNGTHPMSKYLQRLIAIQQNWIKESECAEGENVLKKEATKENEDTEESSNEEANPGPSRRVVHKINRYSNKAVNPRTSSFVVHARNRLRKNAIALLKKEQEKVINGTHPRLIRNHKEIETNHHEILKAIQQNRERETEYAEREYALEIEAATKEFEEEKSELKKNIRAKFEEKKANLKSEHLIKVNINDALGKRRNPTRNLRNTSPRPVRETKKKPPSKKNSKIVHLLPKKEIQEDVKTIAQPAPLTPSNKQNCGQVMGMNGSPSRKLLNDDSSSGNDDDDKENTKEIRIEDGKLFYQRQWYLRGQAIYVEGIEVTKFEAIITAIAGKNTIIVKRVIDDSKFRIYLHKLSSGNITITRRA